MNKVLAILLVFALTLTLASAEWMSLDGSRNQNIEVKVLSSTDSEVKVEITIPGYRQKMIEVNGKKCVAIYMPGSSMLMERGFPMLPQLAKLIKVHDRCDVKLQVLSKEEKDVKLEAPIVPSKGHFTRDISPETVPFEFGPIYSQDIYWPPAEKQFTVGEAFLLRDVRGVRVQVLPIRANHVQMTMKVVTKAVISIVCEGSSDVNVKSMSRFSSAPSKTFKKMYKDAFVNYEETPSRGPEENNKKLVVVTPEKFQAVLGAWIEWKKKSGYQVTVYAVKDGVTAGQIKTYLQGLYDNTATRFGYVVLVGDASYVSNFENSQPMPTFKGKKEGAAADRVYVRLAGNDNYPDAFISRISGNTEAEIKVQVDKFVAYESNPQAGDWIVKGIGIASSEGSPADKERSEWLQNGGGSTQKVPVVAGGLLGGGYKSFDDIYDPQASVSMVANSVNAGRGIITYIGHGSATSWVSSRFSVSDIKKLTNGNMLPLIWSVACVNGQFVHQNECFGEAWLRKADGGAIGIECASTNESWVPPCDKQAATVNAIIKKTHFTFGELEHVGLVASMKAWGDSDSSEGNKMAEQCHLFGDCTLLLRTKVALAINATPSRGLDSNVVFQVTGENRAVANATVTVYTQDLAYAVSGETNEDGSVNISLADMPAGAKLLYTVVGPDLAPIVDQSLD